MNEMKGNLWQLSSGFATCITTNGSLRKNRCCVMEQGLALEANMKWNGLDKTLGELVLKNGNVVQVIGDYELLRMPTQDRYKLIAFPVKHVHRERANLPLIEKSLVQLITLVNKLGLYSIFMPRIGCSHNEGLDWAEQVEPLLYKYLHNDNRFIVVHDDAL